MPARPFSLATENLPHFDFTHVPALKELSYRTYGRDREEVEAEMRAKFDAAYGKPAMPPSLGDALAGLPDPASLYQ